MKPLHIRTEYEGALSSDATGKFAFPVNGTAGSLPGSNGRFFWRL